MTESEKAKIKTLWESGMNLRQIRNMMPFTPREFELEVREMKRNGELTKERKTAEQKVVEAFNRGERNPYKIAEELGITPNSVRAFLSWHKCRKGKKTRNWVHCDRTNAIVADLKAEQLSQAEIARKYGVSRQYITKIKRMVEKWSEQ